MKNINECFSMQNMERLNQALAPLHKQYDQRAKMLTVPFRAFGFFKFLQGIPVHPTRESLIYAVALLDTDDPGMHQRAVNIIEEILNLQDKNPKSKTYGVWPKYLEEKPFKILQPDLNWCDFLATSMLQLILNHHHHQLSPKMRSKIDDSILCAARAIQRRNVPLEYTNIAIMGIYVTLTTGYLYKIDSLYDYALNRLHQFYDYTIEHGGFNEYNSPTYTIITLEVLGRLKLHTQNTEAQKLIEALYHLIWAEIAYRFHPPTFQWSGPHSRSYNTLMESATLALIERSTSERIKFGITETHATLHENSLPLPCPLDLESFFLHLNEPRTVSQTLLKNIPKQVLTTYLAPSFSLGTVNYSDFWHQRRPLIVYWGTPQEPSYLRLRCLYNGVDCAAAQFFSVQSEGSVLSGITFSTNVNPANPYICQNKKHKSKFSIKDLRLRFEFGGLIDVESFQARPPTLVSLESELCLYFRGLYIQIQIPYAQFGERIGKWEIHQKSSHCYLDVVLWSGKRQVFYLSELNQAALGFALQITTEKPSLSRIAVSTIDDCLGMRWKNLNLKFSAQPAEQSSLNASMISSNN